MIEKLSTLWGCRFKRTAFHIACNEGHAKIAEFLIKNSEEFEIDLYARDYFGDTAFHLAIQHTSIVKLLIEKSRDLDLNIKNQHGFTCLHHACGNGYIEVLKFILQHSKESHIDLNIRGKYSL